MTDADIQAARCPPSDAAVAVDLLVEAFLEDPAWSWIIREPRRRPEALRLLWQVFAENSLGYSSLWMTEGATAAAVWFPPDGEEMTPAQEAAVMPELEKLLGDDAPLAFAAMAEFDRAHPHHEPHFNLCLLGTAVAHRGHGYGLRLLAATLEVVDDAGMPAYLEATNPVNVALYERYGFRRFGSFTLPGGGPDVATMWRPAAGERSVPTG